MTTALTSELEGTQAEPWMALPVPGNIESWPPHPSLGAAGISTIDGRQSHEVITKVKLVRFIRLPELMQIVGLGKTTIYARIKMGEFPRPVKIGGRAVGWVESEIIQWASDRIARSRLTTAQALPLAA